MRAPLLVVIAVAVLVVAGASGLLLTKLRAPQMAGTDLGKTPAPPFQLTDQEGQSISLEQFRGKPVVVTFLYTHCPDVCPLIADKLRQTTDLMGPTQTAKIGILAVSTDPQNDTRPAAVQFTAAHQMTGRWHYLLGTPAQLAPIWKAYYVGVTANPSEGATVIHSDAIFVLDKEGRERDLLGSDFQPIDLVKDLQALLSE